MIDAIIGDIREGNTIEVDEGMALHPTVLTFRPNQELRWKGYVGTPGIFDGDHRFVLQADEHGTHVIQSEEFSGVLSGWLTRWIVNSTADAMNEMNRALKTRVELKVKPMQLSTMNIIRPDHRH